MFRYIFIFLFLSLFCTALSFAQELSADLPYDNALMKRINEMEPTNNKKNSPRTKHLDSNGKPKFTNRLALESSPYLLQHAHNPVNWYPWGEKAFEKARQLDRPILLSIGYSTCHWCHVMEEESFEDIEIATYLNEHYIAIKVDREERPDIDSIYMTAVIALQGSGGWPMTVFLTGDKKPFYGGTYFPARDGDRGTPTGFLSILKKLNELYCTDRNSIKKAGSQISEYLKRASLPEPGKSLAGKDLIFQSIKNYKKRFDQINGGLAGQNKFPSSLPLGLLMRHYLTSKDKQVLDMITLTLDRMMTGGIHDHVAGGFHRYTTDSIWLTPHYEKMLYDNAQLAIAYTEAYQLTGNIKYKRISQKTLDYLLKEMQSPEGGFYSATDADSLTPCGEREEGYFFTWTIKEIDALFNERTSKIVRQYYGLRELEDKRQILHISGQQDFITKNFAVSPEELENIIIKANQTLYKKRLTRSLPGLDDKIILSWNSLVISALAKAGFAFNEKKYIDAAIQTHAFVFKNLWHDQKLFHSFKNKKRGHQGFLDDYAFLAAALIDLYEATFDIEWLLKAIDIDDLIQRKFEDKIPGGFFMTPADQKDLIIREKPSNDGAIPSGNAVAVMNLVRLYLYTDRPSYKERAENSLKYFSDALSKLPEHLSGMLLAIELLSRPGKEIVIITPRNGRQQANPFLNVLRNKFIPASVVIVAREGKDLDAKSKVLPHVRGRKTINGMTAAYPCKGKVCRLPVTDPCDL
ncbi:MAG: thioredoxin domain-containing protein [Desulfobacula sp.]|nr:thioredoxin domain-containing protein [Desulfobacula sp.]